MKRIFLFLALFSFITAYDYDTLIESYMIEFENENYYESVLIAEKIQEFDLIVYNRLMGQSYFALGDFKKSERYLTEALKLIKNNINSNDELFVGSLLVDLIKTKFELNLNNEALILANDLLPLYYHNPNTHIEEFSSYPQFTEIESKFFLNKHIVDGYNFYDLFNKAYNNNHSIAATYLDSAISSITNDSLCHFNEMSTLYKDKWSYSGLFVDPLIDIGNDINSRLSVDPLLDLENYINRSSCYTYKKYKLIDNHLALLRKIIATDYSLLGYDENEVIQKKYFFEKSIYYNELATSNFLNIGDYNTALELLISNANVTSNSLMNKSEAFNDLISLLDLDLSIYQDSTVGKLYYNICDIGADTRFAASRGFDNESMQIDFFKNISSICDAAIDINKKINNNTDVLALFTKKIALLTQLGMFDQAKKVESDKNEFYNLLPRDTSHNQDRWDLIIQSLNESMQLYKLQNYDKALQSLESSEKYFQKLLSAENEDFESNSEMLLMYDWLYIIQKKSMGLNYQNHIDNMNYKLNQLDTVNYLGMKPFAKGFLMLEKLYQNNDDKKFGIEAIRLFTESQNFPFMKSWEFLIKQYLVSIYIILNQNEKAIPIVKSSIDKLMEIPILGFPEIDELKNSTFFYAHLLSQNKDTLESINVLENTIQKIEYSTSIYSNQTFERELNENIISLYESLAPIQFFSNQYDEVCYTLSKIKNKKLVQDLELSNLLFADSPILSDSTALIDYEIIHNSNNPDFASHNDNIYGEKNVSYENMFITMYDNFSINNEINQLSDCTTQNDTLKFIDEFRKSLLMSYNSSINSFFINHPYPELKEIPINELIVLYRELISSNHNREDLLFYQISRLLYDYLVGPILPHIKNKRDLIIIPDPILATLPFETLLSPNNKYLIEDFNISYNYSKSLHQYLNSQSMNSNIKSILAFGGANYNNLQIASNRNIPEQVQEYIRENAYNIINSDTSLINVYNMLEVANFKNLPGSKKEVNNLKKYFSQTKIVTGIDVQESYIKKLSKNSNLSSYDILHFATHGITIPEFPELSALVLSNNRFENEDNFLRMDEIRKLNLDADFINLSACDTGLGKQYYSEGLVGISYAFIEAGAKSLSVSLWSVDDNSTAIFMDNLYEKYTVDKIPIYKSMSDVKRSFINGQHGAEYQSPYYWAPFVYYGKQ